MSSPLTLQILLVWFLTGSGPHGQLNHHHGSPCDPILGPRRVVLVGSQEAEKAFYYGSVNEKALVSGEATARSAMCLGAEGTFYGCRDL